MNVEPRICWQQEKREEGRNQRPQPLQELVLGRVLSVRCHPPDYGRQWFDGAERNVIGTNIFESLREGGIVFHHYRISHRAEPIFSKKS